MKSMNTRFRSYAWIASLALLWTVLLPSFNHTVYAAVPQLDNIRVALFIQARETAPAVTLSIASPAEIGIRTPEGIRNWLSVTDGSPVRFSVDQYRILMLETLDLHEAQAAASALASVTNSRERVFVLATSRGGHSIYEVLIGQYTNLQEALQAQERLLANATAVAVLNGFSPAIKGPHRLTAGSFASEEEARAVLALYQERGIEAALAYHENDSGELVYAVWIGAASTPEQLEVIHAETLALVPEFPLSMIDPALPYLYERFDHSEAQPIAHYSFNSNGQKVWYSAAAPGIKVQERYNRTYRGSMEITQYNGRLALINELPFEQYLYAVVSNEMGGGFPMEALKAQAVAARTYALQQGMRYGIAHISDTVYDQAYYGYGSESAKARQAVDETASEVVVNAADNSLITPFYSSNAGGFTAETDEVWGTAVPYIHSLPSPDDVAEEGRHTWYRVLLSDGQVGYVRHDLVTVSGSTPSGLMLLTVLENTVNVRPSPDTGGTPLTQVNRGDRLIVLETVKESNPYSWTTSLWTADALLQRINQYVRTPISGQLQSLRVVERGASGRVITIMANESQALDVSYPDAYRTVLGGLRSTRFDIDQTNDITILGAAGTTNIKHMSGGQLYVLSGSQTEAPQPVQTGSPYLYLMNKDRDIRVGTLDPRYRFIGRGYGHGLGMSQYGAKALADIGYDYKRILQYYYKNVQIIKG